MLKSLHIQNFRSFLELHVEPLARVNLISGKNNVGKSSLLESLYLLGRRGATDAVPELNRFRGLAGGRSRAEASCLWMFNGRYSRNGINIVSKIDDGTEEELTLQIYKDTSYIPTSFAPSYSQQFGPFLSMLLKDQRGPCMTSLFTSHGATTGGFLLLDAPPTGSPAGSGGEDENRCALVGHRAWDRTHDLELFSRLRSDGTHHPVIASLKAIDSRLTDLEMLVLDGEAGFHANLDGQGGLVPLWSLGEGFRHLLSMVTAVASCRDSMVLIDEIENGLHYSVLHVWTAISKAAEEANVQVFATTHSRECVAAAHESLSSKGDDEFRVHRLERGRSGEVEAVTYDRESLTFSLEQGWEVR